MKAKKTERFELGRATIFVTRASLDLDRAARGYYRCDVHPVGGPVSRVWLRAASAEGAARDAVASYESANLKKNLPGKF